MPHPLLAQFENHPQERDVIGRIILAYGELEFMWLDMLRATQNDDLMRSLRAMYRVRSESSRLELADAFARTAMSEQGLLPAYEEAWTAMQFCKGVRNTYAHCQWVSIHGRLHYGDLDTSAKTRLGTAQITMKHVSLEFLARQYTYFAYTEHAAVYATNQYRIKTGQKLPEDMVIPKPRKIQPPKRENHQSKHPLQRGKPA